MTFFIYSVFIYMILILSNATCFLEFFFIPHFFLLLDRIVKPESLPTFFPFWFYIGSLLAIV